MLPYLLRFLVLAVLAAFSVAQSAVLSFTRVPNPVTAGEPQALLYATNNSQSDVQILLRQGAANDIRTIATLTTDASGGQYIWTPSTSLPNGIDYVLQILQAGESNYFGPFTLQGGSEAVAASFSQSTSSGTGLSSSTSTQQSVSTTSGVPQSTVATTRNTARPSSSASSGVSSEPTKGGFSTGAAAGVGVGATLAIVLAVVAVFWTLRRRRRQQGVIAKTGQRGEEENEVLALPSKPEKDGTQRYEAPDTSRIAEVEGSGRAELDGGWRPAEVGKK